MNVKSPIQRYDIPSRISPEILVKLITDLASIHKIFVSKMDEVKYLIDEKIGPEGKKGDKGETGKDGRSINEQKVFDYCTTWIDNYLKNNLRQPEDGKSGASGKDGRTPVRGVDYFTESDIEIIYGVFKARMNLENPKETEEAQDEKFLHIFTKKGKKLSTKHIDGLEQTLSALKNQTQHGYLHGGGVPSLSAGTGVTLTPKADGGFTVSSSVSGANVASELVTAVTSGSNVTIDLTTLSHAYIAIIGIFRNGAKLPNRTNDGSSSSWTRSINTVTVFNAASTDDYLVDYTY